MGASGAGEIAYLCDIAKPDIAVVNNIQPVSYTHLRAHETPEHLVCRPLLEKKKKLDYL